MRILVTFCLLISSLGLARAQSVERIDITEIGIYTKRTDKTVSAPGTPVGTRDIVSDIQLVQSTTSIPARVGVTFGFHYRIIGPGKSVSMTKITHIPSPGIRNPDTGNVTLTDKYSIDRSIGDIHFTSYSFGHDRELIPGTWIVELWVGDRKLASQSFQVIKQ
jgi:hypothetical protein